MDNMEPQRKYSVKRTRDWPDLEYLSDYGTSHTFTSTTTYKLPAKRIKKEIKREVSPPPPPSRPDTRINFSLAPGERVLECPYDRNHLILEQRWIRHLCKCRSNYLKDSAAKGTPITIGICKWNNGHHFHVNDLRSHEMMCLDRRPEQYQPMNYFTGPNPKTQHEKLDDAGTEDEEGNTSDEEDFETDSTTQSSRQQKTNNTLKADAEDKTGDWDDESSSVTPGQAAYDPRKAILSNNIPL